VPESLNAEVSRALVIVLHPGLGNAAIAARMTGMSTKAGKEGFFVAYPQGSGTLPDRLLTWNAGKCCGYAKAHKVDDVGFVKRLIDTVKSEHNIDSNAVFITGMSNGAMMAYRLACELSDTVAAIAPVSGSLDIEHCRPEHPVSVIIFHGLKDKRIRFEGGKPHKQADWHERVDLSVDEAAAFWVTHNECDASPETTETDTLLVRRFSRGKANSEVVLYALKEQGHAWPGGTKGRAAGDEPSREISATDLMWDFFLEHPKTAMMD
jgi:polyhydroxybutyrate depolymerase